MVELRKLHSMSPKDQFGKKQKLKNNYKFCGFFRFSEKSLKLLSKHFCTEEFSTAFRVSRRFFWWFSGGNTFRFFHFWPFLQCLRRKNAEEYLLKKEIWVVDHFQLLKEKISTFSTNAFQLGSHNCLPPIQMKILRTFSRKYFSFLSLLELDGNIFGLCGKNNLRGRNFPAF